MILTNGVSFELVAGACVAVYFSNGAYGKNVGVLTLNVNSTGAKPLMSYQSSINSTQFYSRNNQWSAQYRGNDGQPPQKCLYFYDGSNYAHGSTRVYGDYGDSD